MAAINHQYCVRTLIPTSHPSGPKFQLRLQNLNLNFPPHFVSSNRSFTVSATASSSAPNAALHPRLNNSSKNMAPNSSTCSSSWSEFAGNVSGEWDGYGADFTVEGKPIELPENVVPEAYREWEVRVFDWQTQCPTLAQPDDFTVMYKLIKLLPTVGCEADAATRHSIDERNIGGSNNSASAFAYQSNGCYVAVWSTEEHGSDRVLELEHCLINPQDRESRVRIFQCVRVENCKLVLKSIRVFVEQWYGPFRDGDQLGGCSIRDTAFASTDALKGSEVVGIWQGSSAVANFRNSQDSIFQELIEDSTTKTTRNEHNLVLLPKNLWTTLKEREDGETWCEVGWLCEQGHAITSRCVFSIHAELKEIITSREKTQER